MSAIVPSKLKHKQAITTQETEALAKILEDQRRRFDRAIGLLLYSLSQTSQRVYSHTFDLWLRFTQKHQLDPLDFDAESLRDFLEDGDLSKTTKQARLSHMRNLLKALASTDPIRYEPYYRQAQMLKIKSRNTGKTRKTKALNRDEVYNVFAVWSNTTVLHARNRAILAVLFYGGLRRSEIVALKWSDFDLRDGFITVEHGKGDKSRIVPIANDEALTHIREWARHCKGRVYAFPMMRKGDHLGPDRPMTDDGLYKVIKNSGNFAPHDGRRTLITGLLNAGSSVADVQALAGHSRGETTLRYAKARDAAEIKERLKLDY